MSESSLKSLNYLDAPCIIIDPNSEQEALIMLSENLQRKDLTEVEKAEAIWEYKVESHFPVRQIADKLGVTHTYINNLLSIHGYPDEVKLMIKAGELAANTTVPLKQLETDTEKIKTAQFIADNELNHKQAKQVVEVVKTNLPNPNVV